MSFNLTPKQRDDLKWVIEMIQAGKLEESFVINWAFEGRITYGWVGPEVGEPRFLNRGTLEAWDRSGLMIVVQSDEPIRHGSPHTISYARCTVTQMAYDALAAGFAPPVRTMNTRRLMQFLSSNFSLNEMRTAAAMMGIPHDNIEGTTVDVYARELVSYVQRRNLVWELVGVALSLD